MHGARWDDGPAVPAEIKIHWIEPLAINRSVSRSDVPPAVDQTE